MTDGTESTPEPTFRYETSIKSSDDSPVRPGSVEAFMTSCDYICVHRAETRLDLEDGTEWIVSHMPTGAALWMGARSIAQGRMFALSLQHLLGDEFLLKMKPGDENQRLASEAIRKAYTEVVMSGFKGKVYNA